MNARLKAVREQYWTTRPAHERRLLLAVGAVVLPFLAYALLWRPAHQEVAKLQLLLPAQRIQAASMQQWAKEIDELRHRPAIAVLAPNALRAGVEESAVRHQVRAAINSIEVQEPNGVRVVIDAMSFARWLDWLRSLQQEQHIRVESLAITSLQETGMVSIRATMVSGPSQ